MKNKIKIPKELLMTIDVNNTLNGGASQPELSIERKKEGYELIVSAPGVDADQLEVEIVKNKLLVYYSLPVFKQRFEEEESFQSPRILANVGLPHDVDPETVSARYDQWESNLVVVMPYNHLHDGFRRKIDVERW